MIQDWIIEEIRRRELEQARAERPRLELPLIVPPPECDDEAERAHEEESDRGVVILDMG